MKVLFVHGLESGVNGNKARYLREHFDTNVPAMKNPYSVVASALVIIGTAPIPHYSMHI
jgi:hypothetical protein